MGVRGPRKAQRAGDKSKTSTRHSSGFSSRLCSHTHGSHAPAQMHMHAHAKRRPRHGDTRARFPADTTWIQHARMHTYMHAPTHTHACMRMHARPPAAPYVRRAWRVRPPSSASRTPRRGCARRGPAAPRWAAAAAGLRSPHRIASHGMAPHRIASHRMASHGVRACVPKYTQCIRMHAHNAQSGAEWSPRVGQRKISGTKEKAGIIKNEENGMEKKRASK